MKPVDLTKYPLKSQIQLAKSNPNIQSAMVSAKSLDDFLSTIKSRVIISEDALDYFIVKYIHN